MKTQWTFEEWQESRLQRRRATDRISPTDCGKPTSRGDAALREAFGGKRNSPFASTDELERLATERVLRKNGGAEVARGGCVHRGGCGDGERGKKRIDPRETGP